MNRSSFLKLFTCLAITATLCACDNNLKLDKNEFPVYLSAVNTSENKDIKIFVEDADSISIRIISKGKGTKVYPVRSFSPNKLIGKIFSVVDSVFYLGKNFEFSYIQKDTVTLFSFEDKDLRLCVLPVKDKFLRYIKNEDSKPSDTALASLRIFNPDTQNDTLIYTLKQNNAVVAQLSLTALAYSYLLLPPGDLSVMVAKTDATTIAIQDGLKLAPKKRYELYQNQAIGGNIDSLKASNSNTSGVVLLLKSYQQ